MSLVIEEGVWRRRVRHDRCIGAFTCQITESREQHLDCNLSKTLSFPRTVHIFSSKPHSRRRMMLCCILEISVQLKTNDSHYV